MSLDRAYVTVISYPPDLSERQRTVALSEALKVDEYTAEIAQRWQAPAIVRICTTAEGHETVRVLEDLGIQAFSARQSALDKLGRPIVAKRLLPAIGSPRPMYGYEPLRPRLHQGGSMVMEEVFAMFAGRVKERRSVTPTPVPTGEYGYPGDATGAAGAAGRSGVGGNVVASRATERFLLDIYLVDSRRIRIDTGQFSFDFLGGKLGYTDRENFDRACTRLRAEAPGAIFDDRFESFRPPANRTARSSRAFGDGAVSIIDTGPAFDFYSTWKCLLLVHLRNRSRAP
ncbi:MAG: hypothetical protein KF805_04945 [Phycisphaeraceae bacterium]|nr:hypothetical protein [Phycisphaeraceae bacterium]